ncbi:hypothetical protein RRG08_065205 [Elysia crispata]|uniref:Uncharacterized protein n=1 Tax=Elysia crispata TaxID=231223 RepID=A0AAE1D131_9GAST|nr:hypothetical protein RRG08_065205 [Elysia crispata]
MYTPLVSTLRAAVSPESMHGVIEWRFGPTPWLEPTSQCVVEVGQIPGGDWWTRSATVTEEAGQDQPRFVSFLMLAAELDVAPTLTLTPLDNDPAQPDTGHMWTDHIHHNSGPACYATQLASQPVIIGRQFVTDHTSAACSYTFTSQTPGLKFSYDSKDSYIHTDASDITVIPPATAI